MKNLMKFFGLGLLALGCLLSGLITYLNLALPHLKPAEDIKVEATSARLKRGDYLVHAVADCYSCHSIRDFSKFGGPIVKGSEFAGGEPFFDEHIGLPGKVPPKNITPYNLRSYTDGELVRVLRTGVRKNGEPLFPMMPYQHYAQLTQEDLYSVIAYVRSLPEKQKDIPEHRLQFPVNLIVRTIPKEAPPYPQAVDPKDNVAYGKYLVNAAACMECHTPVDAHHQPLEGMDLAGGQEFPSPDESQDIAKAGVVRTANLTPDMETGIGAWSKEVFVQRFTAYRGKEGAAQKVKHGDFNTVMPIYYYANMKDADLGAIYDYLRTIKAVKNKIVKFTPPAI